MANLFGIEISNNSKHELTVLKGESPRTVINQIMKEKFSHKTALAGLQRDDQIRRHEQLTIKLWIATEGEAV